MKHTTVCGKSADRPIGGPCGRRPRPRTLIGAEPEWSPPTSAVDWLFNVSSQKKAEKEIDPAYAQMWFVRLPKQAAISLWFIGLKIFISMSITRISSCKLETSPRWNLIGQFSHKLTSQYSRCLSSFTVSSAGRRLVTVMSHFMPYRSRQRFPAWSPVVRGRQKSGMWAELLSRRMLQLLCKV